MRKIWNTMLKGLVAILPISLTLYLVFWLAVTAEQLFSGTIKLLIPEGAYWPGLGLLAGLVVLYLIGLVVNAYFVSRALRISDRLFARIPVVKTIYLTIRDFMRFFPSSGQGSDLKRVVMVPFGPGQGDRLRHRRVRCGARDRRLERRTVAVYLPMSYMIGGYTVFLPREATEPTSLSVEAGLRIALMGGVQSARVPGPPPPGPA